MTQLMAEFRDIEIVIPRKLVVVRCKLCPTILRMGNKKGLCSVCERLAPPRVVPTTRICKRPGCGRYVFGRVSKVYCCDDCGNLMRAIEQNKRRGERKREQSR